MNIPLIMSGLLTVIIAILAYILLVPKNSNILNVDNDEESSDNKAVKLMTIISNELYSSLPAGMARDKRKNKNAKIESLIVRSGNPWGLKADEFIVFQYASAFIGFLLSWLVWLGTKSFIGLPWWITVLGITIFAFYIPRIKYQEEAKRRDIEFKRQLPEALDLMVISLSGGVTFQQSVREVIPNMQEGVLKEEFENIVKALDSGRTLNEALENFATRAPNESILTFIRSVQSATEINSPLGEILESRAEASRQEFFAMIHEKTAQLESKIWMVLSPTLLPAVLIIAVAPSVSSMITTLGS